MNVTVMPPEALSAQRTRFRLYDKLRRSWREGKTTNEVFLGDYAAVILGLLELYQTDFDVKWFKAARELTNKMIQ